MSTSIGTVTKNSRERLEVQLGDFKGHRYAEVRTYFTPDGGETYRPTTKGVTLKIECISELIDLLRRAQEEAVSLGLIEGAP